VRIDPEIKLPRRERVASLVPARPPST
jgi:hypothetical protein